ncbi:MAG: CBS domain-containing protein, partial [Candidatus Omnitrophica bacterium]|nr:CBS domain-containing protein [Candidatus Omnitrophota bacterium]
LSVVSSYLNRELSEGELSMLTKLISGTKRIVAKGVNVSLIEHDSESYAGELGMIMHKLMEIENIPVLFVLVNSPRRRVDIIARSSLQAVDVNKIMAHFGGGGHPGAASAKIRDTDIGAVRDKLMKVLKDNIKVRSYAKDVMSKEVKALSVNDSIDTARKALSDTKLGGMPVMDNGKVVGIITPDCLNKADKGGLGHSRVKGYMSRNIVSVKPGTPLHAVRKIVSEHDIGVIPVMSNKRVVGVINRTDILRNIHDSLFLKPHAVKKQVVVNMSKKMSALLPGEIMTLLGKIGRKANSLGYGAFCVGGLVRDLMLGVKNLDLDIVVEGAAIELGRVLARDLKASLVAHRRFGTCSVITKGRLKIDLATARKEVYERPAALPTVEFSSLKNDLVRRDFTINAMAISLNKASFGRLVDFFSGEADLARGRIRVMHDGSFIDDPTRIFRAVRFEQRFGFIIDSHTEDLIKHAISLEMFDKVEPQRIRDEVVLILKEEEPFKALRRMAELDELRFLHPGIRWDRRIINLYRSIEKTCRWYDRAIFKKRNIDKWIIYLMALIEEISYKDVAAMCGRFVFRRGDTIRILSYKESADKVSKALMPANAVQSSTVYNLLEPLSFEVILLIMARSGSKKARSRIEDFFRKYNGTKIRIKGDDLKSMGMKPCPDFKLILDKVLDARINGLLKTKKDELAYAGKLVRRRCV